MATNTVYRFETARGQVVDQAPNWATVSAESRYCCVSNVLSDDVSILDTATRREVARIKTGQQPKRLVAVNAS